MQQTQLQCSRDFVERLEIIKVVEIVIRSELIVVPFSTSFCGRPEVM